MPRTITAPAALSVLDSVPKPKNPTSCGSIWFCTIKRSTAFAAIVYTFSWRAGTRKLRPTTTWILSQEFPVQLHQS
jgi:hypothetical protein